MAPRPRWWHTLQASKNEAVLAVDLYNRSGSERQLEAFIVHMSLAWLRLLQAKVGSDGGDLFVRDRRGRRVRADDGAWKYKPLSALTKEVMGATDPRTANLEFFTGLRNRIEHRHEKDIAGLVAGRTQAHVLNYERTLVEWFGTGESVGSQLRFPLFVSSITDDAVEALKAVRRRVPKGVLEWVQDFDSGLEPTLAADQQYDFRVYLVPQTGPKSEADAAMTFVRMEELDESQQQALEHVQQIIREKKVPVSDLDTLKPTQVAERVAQSLGKPFSVNNHTQAWRHYKVRPGNGSDRPEVTKSDFCRYNATFEQYVYTEAWVKFLARKLADPATYALIRSGRAEEGAEDE